MRIAGFLVITCLAFVLGCDPAYFSKYRIVSSRTAGPLCPQIQDPNELLEYVRTTMNSIEMPDEERAFRQMCNRLFSADDGTVILEFAALTSYREINKTKEYEKQLVRKLKQEKCIEVIAIW